MQSVEGDTIPKLDIAYREALRLLNQQESTLDELRARTGTLMGLFVVATAFFGSRVHYGSSVTGLQAAALVVFLIVLTVQAWILVPRKDWFFNTEVQNNLDDAFDDESLADYYKSLIEEFGRMAKANDEKLKPLQRQFSISVAMLVVNMLLWTLAVLRR